VDFDYNQEDLAVCPQNRTKRGRPAKNERIKSAVELKTQNKRRKIENVSLWCIGTHIPIYLCGTFYVYVCVQSYSHVSIYTRKHT
jgi:hypothetical protein